MAKQTFTTGQVLTASQLTNLQQTALGGGSPSVKTTSYVLVAADAGTVIQMNSTSATTVTVNTGLFSAGDSVQIQNIGSGTTTITAGTATVNSAGSLAVTQYDGGFLYFSSASSAIWFDYTQPGTTSPLTTKGDLYTRTSSGDTRIGVGANGTTLVADSAEATGLKWATPSSGGGMTLLATTTLSGSSVTVSSLSTSYKNLLIVWNKAYASTNCDFSVRYNSDTGTNYYNGLVQYNTYEFNTYPNNDSSKFGSLSTNNSDKESANGYAEIFRYAEGDSKFIYSNNFQKYGASLMFPQTNFCNYDSSTAISSLTFIVNTGTFSGGTVYTYGVS